MLDRYKKGPCSNKNMLVIYTCNQLKCSILCSFKISVHHQKIIAKLSVKSFLAQVAHSMQWPKHRILLDNEFDIKKHEYSVKAIINCAVKFIVKHTDIPLNQVVKLEDYCQAMERVARQANLTCASCIKMFPEPTNRKRHKDSLHEKKIEPFHCS